MHVMLLPMEQLRGPKFRASTSEGEAPIGEVEALRDAAAPVEEVQD